MPPQLRMDRDKFPKEVAADIQNNLTNVHEVLHDCIASLDYADSNYKANSDDLNDCQNKLEQCTKDIQEALKVSDKIINPDDTLQQLVVHFLKLALCYRHIDCSNWGVVVLLLGGGAIGGAVAAGMNIQELKVDNSNSCSRT